MTFQSAAAGRPSPAQRPLWWERPEAIGLTLENTTSPEQILYSQGTHKAGSVFGLRKEPDFFCANHVAARCFLLSASDPVLSRKLGAQIPIWRITRSRSKG